MYYYIIDPSKLPLEKFERLQVELQGLLSEFKISGELARVTTLRSIADLVDTAATRGVKTLVACGSDDTFNLMLAALKGRDFTLGFIPFHEDSYLSRILGIEDLRAAAKTIAARRIERIDMAKIGPSYFMSYVEFGTVSQNLKQAGWLQSLKMLTKASATMSFRIDDSYTVELPALGGMLVNSRLTSSRTESLANPTDGLLDLMILERLTKLDTLKFKNAIVEGRLEEVPNTTVIKCRSVQFLQPRGLPLTMSGRVVGKFPVTVTMADQKVRLIVGKNRTF